MRNTTYYNLNIVEGSDIVNPLTVDNPNYEIIDEAMHDNAVSGVTLATEIANAKVHAITRENSECAVIRFIATSEWKAGDTVTVDSVPVTALLPSGETLPDGAYVINSNVLCILTGTNMTVFAERKKIDTANEIKYNSTNVGEELDKINSNLGNLIKKTVLWENTSKNANFSSQEITLNDNADSYDIHIYKFRKSVGSSVFHTVVTYGSYNPFVSIVEDVGGGIAFLRQRAVSYINQYKINIGGGELQTLDSTTVSLDNSVLIPELIIGIKLG